MNKSLPDSITALVEQTRRIPINQIRESIMMLRSEESYDDESLDELGDSLKKRQLQTIVVQPAADADDLYDLVIGSRRFRAAKRKRMTEIAAYVIEKQTPVELLFIALAENIHRVDLNPFEEAQGFLRLMKEYNVDLKDVAKGINKPEAYVRSRMQLLSMPEEVVTLVSEKKLGIGHVRPLARMPSGEDQVRLAQVAVRNNLTEPELRAEVARELQEPTRQGRSKRELTAVKVQARVREFIQFVQKVPRRLNLRRVNANERQDTVIALQSLEDEVRALKGTIKNAQTSSARSVHPNLTRDHTTPSNDGEDWTTKDIRRINSLRRPSDEDLADELGRSVGAIRAMRSKTFEKA